MNEWVWTLARKAFGEFRFPELNEGTERNINSRMIYV